MNLPISLMPWRTYICIGAVVVAFVFGWSAAWKIQNGLQAEREGKIVQQTLLATQAAAANAIRRVDNVIAAQNAAMLRDRVLRADAAGSRNALIGLSLAADEALRRAEATHDACLVTANAQNIVLNQCGARYRDLAETADRHASDTQTLIDAWPK